MKLMARTIAAAVAVSILAGCATRPLGSPGTGYGSEYTPIVDMRGVDSARWASDLAECRDYARQVDTAGNAATGAVAGAILGAALMAAAGGNRRWTERNASVGAVQGTAAGLGSGVQKERLVMNNCIIGRGYRVLDGNVAFVPQQPPAVPMVAAHAETIATANPPMAHSVAESAAPVSGFQPAVYRAPPPTPIATAVARGKWWRESERLASFMGCGVPVARLTLAEPDFERYAVRCGGDGGEENLRLNCEKGHCSSAR
jgi:hypothetical protein